MRRSSQRTRRSASTTSLAPSPRGSATGSPADAHRDAFAAFAGLRPSVDSFFDKVTVNAPDPALRANRLRLMDRVRLPFHAVADFSLIEG